MRPAELVAAWVEAFNRRDIDRLLETGNRPGQGLGGALVGEEAALEVRRVRVRLVALGRALHGVIGGTEAWAQRSRNGPGDVLLDREHILGVAVVAFRP